MADILIKNMEMPKGEDVLFLELYSDGTVYKTFSNKVQMCHDSKAIELQPHKGIELDLYDYIKQGSYFIKLNRIASELSFLIHCEKEKKIKDVLGRLVAMRNAIWDSVTLEASNGSDS